MGLGVQCLGFRWVLGLVIKVFLESLGSGCKGQRV